jgi:hypothetical protein
MFDNLQDIIIITTSGKVIASRITHPNIQEQLFGMLFSAFNSFTQEIFNNNLIRIEMNTIRLDLLHKNNIIFIGTSTKNMAPEETKKDLNLLAEHFFSKYSQDVLTSWSGALYIFAEFENELNTNNTTLLN